MSWIVIAWSMMASACLTLALIHLSIWAKERAQLAHLLFAIIAMAVTSIAAFEVLMMRAETIEEFGRAQRWAHVPVFVAVVAMVWFVRAFLGTGRLWLAYAVCALRLLSLVANFLSDASLNYTQITGLRQLELWGGETLAVADGVFNPWTRLGQLSLLLLVVYVVDASVAVWRRGSLEARRRAAVVGGSIVFFIVVAAGHAGLVHQGAISSPYMITPAFLAMVLAMGYELGTHVSRADRLDRQLQASDAQLRDSEQRMDLAASAAELGLWEWDVLRDEVWATDQCRALFGFTPVERIDLRRFVEALHPDDRERIRAGVAGALQDGKDYEAEYRAVLPGGRTRWIAGRGRVERDGQGKPSVMRGVAIDITERRRLELEATERRDELAHLSRVAMLGELSGSLAHELNQPLAAILSNAQAAQRFLAAGTAHMDEVRDILRDIVEDDRRAGEVIRRLRVLLKKDEVRHLPLDINEVVTDVLRLMRSDLLNRNVAVNTEFAPRLPPVTGDSVQLQQVLLNLVINGCDAMEDVSQRDKRLIVRTALADGNQAIVSVADRGKGIPLDGLERVFEPFMTTKTHGMGLGLAVCRSIVTAHGGRIWAANNADRGATFHFTVLASHEGYAQSRADDLRSG